MYVQLLSLQSIKDSQIVPEPSRQLYNCNALGTTIVSPLCHILIFAQAAAC